MSRPLALATLAVAMIGAVCGCANFGEPPPRSAVLTPAALGATDPATAWPAADAWNQFGDASLAAWIARALHDQPSLALAQARLARASAAARLAGQAGAPQLAVQADATRQRFTATGLYPPPYGGAVFWTADAQLTGSIELDFFGRHAAALRAALSQQRSAAADAQAARVLLAANVTRNWLQLARLGAQRELAVATRTTREQLLGLVQARIQAGLDTRVELRQAEGVQAEIGQQIEALDEQIALARHALAALAGAGPEAAADVLPAFAQVPAPALPQAIPADLVGHRADLVAARWRVEAALGGIDAARAAFYPNLDLVAFAGLSSFGLTNLIKSDSTTWGVGPALHLPLFDAGRLRASYRGSVADLDAAVAGYDAALLDAVREVADLAASLQSIARQAQAQQVALEAADGAYQLAVLRYRGGLGTFLTVLTAEGNVLTQRRGATDLRARALDTQVQLLRALGGGFADDPVPAERTQTQRAQPAPGSAS